MRATVQCLLTQTLAGDEGAFESLVAAVLDDSHTDFAELVHAMMTAEEYSSSLLQLLSAVRRHLCQEKVCQLDQTMLQLCCGAFQLRVLYTDEDDYHEARQVKVRNAWLLGVLCAEDRAPVKTAVGIARELLAVETGIEPSHADVLAASVLLQAGGLSRLHDAEIVQTVSRWAPAHPCEGTRTILRDLHAKYSQIQQAPPSEPTRQPSPTYSSHDSLSHDSSSSASSSDLRRSGTAPPSAAALKDAVSRTVYAVGIETRMNEETLLAFLSEFGELQKVRLCGDVNKDTLYAFIEYTTRDEAESLVRASGARVGAYNVKFSWARSAIRSTKSMMHTSSIIRDLSIHPETDSSRAGSEGPPSPPTTDLSHSLLTERNSRCPRGARKW